MTSFSLDYRNGSIFHQQWIYNAKNLSFMRVKQDLSCAKSRFNVSWLQCSFSMCPNRARDFLLWAPDRCPFSFHIFNGPYQIQLKRCLIRRIKRIANCFDGDLFQNWGIFLRFLARMLLTRRYILQKHRLALSFKNIPKTRFVTLFFISKLLR